ncbi:hypothetical protein HMPREF1083_02724 [[Clostridium] clostridioforme 90A6]|uniref:Uncharacterized protein n=2 Tax=Enterocloster clostridioformis TaxID=1531 RepID=R0BI67_9FIRM|nr:hypothetical protein HMPREF9467_02651 [ [[Clostridium] clostridioforme 2_1_49FAA]ENY94798.1 hypothetical protein HMPREF1098_01648 [[Clostridium] clostridioforme CM201]ENZ03866.1 hypothetical protein HMPREF1086_03899 [[Clostridium] clostridioforme 90B1]ENZ19806.1 hypothetical protein HMPREF1088_04286 [[Clostridium] clostridioforme 90A3]ENZ24612.1 hypothetical protein HMPREF1087_04043 [[Clostridium] clostridioforme 90A1]ENZ64090.1 hypothetical protein HMPREF1083_02724 [[Clostridium] clostridi
MMLDKYGMKIQVREGICANRFFPLFFSIK